MAAPKNKRIRVSISCVRVHVYSYAALKQAFVTRNQFRSQIRSPKDERIGVQR